MSEARVVNTVVVVEEGVSQNAVSLVLRRYLAGVKSEINKEKAPQSMQNAHDVAVVKPLISLIRLYVG